MFHVQHREKVEVEPRIEIKAFLQSLFRVLARHLTNARCNKIQTKKNVMILWASAWRIKNLSRTRKRLKERIENPQPQLSIHRGIKIGPAVCCLESLAVSVRWL